MDLKFIADDILTYRGRYIQRDFTGSTLEEFTSVVSWWVEEEGHYEISDQLIPLMFQMWNDEYSFRRY